MFLLHVIIFIVLMAFSIKAYQHQSFWLRFIPFLLLKWGEGRSFAWQLMIYSPIFIIWLLSCHWLDAKGWYGLGASGLGIAMLLGLQALKMIEEKQKKMREKI